MFRLDEARRLPKVINAPLIYVNSEGGRVGRPILTIERAKEFGYRMLEDAIGTVIVTYTAIKDMYERLRSTGVAGLDQSKAVPARKEIEEMIGLSTYYRIEEITTEKKR